MALFSSTVGKKDMLNKVISIDTEKILANPAQPRQYFDQKELESLADSIRNNGILQPLTVRKNSWGSYELITGERRLRAARLINMKKVPCIVYNTTDKNSAILALIENLQRKDLNFFEEAKAIENLIVEWNITQEEASLRLGKAQSTIANKLRLLRLPENQQKKIQDSHLTERHARAFLKIDNEELRNKAIYYVCIKNLNVSQTEQYIEQLLNGTTKKSGQTMIPVIKDVRIFVNTINQAIDIMKKAGINASSEKLEREDGIEYIVKIPYSK